MGNSVDGRRHSGESQPDDAMNQSRNLEIGGQSRNQQKDVKFGDRNTGGLTYNPEEGGQYRNQMIGGQSEDQYRNQMIGGQSEDPRNSGQYRNQMIGGQSEDPRNSGQYRNQMIGGQSEDPRNSGQYRNQMIGGQSEDPRNNGQYLIQKDQQRHLHTNPASASGVQKDVPDNSRDERFLIESLQQENAALKRQNKELEKYKIEVRDMKDQMQNRASETRDGKRVLLMQELQEVKKDRDNILTRYSALAASTLTTGNANIADLSDQNRPTKLAERYSELYDNEWTEALCVLTESGGRTEDDVCHILAKALCIIYSTCRKEADDELIAFINNSKSFYKVNELSKEMVKDIKDRRKKFPGGNVEKIMKLCSVDMGRILSVEEQSRISEFLHKSTELCWLMAIQDPPVYVGTNISRMDEGFNLDLFKPYTKTGNYIDFIVWPALFLYEGGSVLCKGIAQGTKIIKTTQPNGKEQIIHKTSITNVQASSFPASYPAPVKADATRTVTASAVGKHDPVGRGIATEPQPHHSTGQKISWKQWRDQPKEKRNQKKKTKHLSFKQ